jgi:hypothetical protein
LGEEEEKEENIFAAAQISVASSSSLLGVARALFPNAVCYYFEHLRELVG